MRKFYAQEMVDGEWQHLPETPEADALIEKVEKLGDRVSAIGWFFGTEFVDFPFHQMEVDGRQVRVQRSEPC
jgi:hypothetical protein